MSLATGRRILPTVGASRATPRNLCRTAAPSGRNATAHTSPANSAATPRASASNSASHTEPRHGREEPVAASAPLQILRWKKNRSLLHRVRVSIFEISPPVSDVQ
ncbi:hypothetical protein PVAP13_3NG271925 [Panicum virgatum]|uniref:Uncharacterized protein n=1 Tax=Panicum virgatum TaxID=38727 RepID=A0A8T0UJM9_PANVG|nr:hypothetical protein PVAP13_3NG271925 [Panicum virgatum]